MYKRHFNDSELKALAHVFDIKYDSKIFEPLSKKEIAEKAEELFPREEREKAINKINLLIDSLF